MGQDSKIQWCDHTFNPWVGCTKVSDGCKFCYAEALMDKRWGKVKWGQQGERKRTSDANWKEPLRWDRAAGAAGERHRVFCASLADVFEGRPELDEWLVDLLLLIDSTPNLDWLLLTKRPENIPTLLPTSFQKYPRANVWLGTSVENRAAAQRILHLCAVPAAIRFVSFEPLLEDMGDVQDMLAQGIDWAIIGGESGPGARPFETGWARGLIRQCREIGAAPFVKQLGSTPYANDWEGCAVPMRLKDHKGGDPSEWPEDIRVRDFPTMARYRQFPAAQEQRA